MSEENVELARRYFEAFNARGLDGVVRLWHPDIEAFDPPTFPDADRYVGAAAVRGRVQSYIDLGWDPKFRDPEFLDAGDEVVIIWRAEGRSPHGLTVEQTIAHVFLFEDGKVRRIRQYLSREEALEAAGLSE